MSVKRPGLPGAAIDTLGHTGVAQAFAVAGLVAHGAMEIEAPSCVDAVHPGFYDQLEALRPGTSKEKT